MVCNWLLCNNDKIIIIITCSSNQIVAGGLEQDNLHVHVSLGMDIIFLRRGEGLAILWGVRFFSSILGCAWIFWVGDNLCKNLFNIENRTWIAQSTYSIFPPWLPLHDFFSHIFCEKEVLFNCSTPHHPPSINNGLPLMFIPMFLCKTTVINDHYTLVAYMI